MIVVIEGLRVSHAVARIDPVSEKFHSNGGNEAWLAWIVFNLIGRDNKDGCAETNKTRISAGEKSRVSMVTLADPLYPAYTAMLMGSLQATIKFITHLIKSRVRVYLHELREGGRRAYPEVCHDLLIKDVGFFLTREFQILSALSNPREQPKQ